MTFRNSIAIFGLFLLFTISCSDRNQDNEFGIGNPAPEIKVTDWVTQRINGKHLFEGKTVILEFWATWCGPCIAYIPHLNDLSDRYADDDVVFISITDENKEKVENFLTRKEMKTIVATDTTKTTMKLFQVSGIPKTFIIDKNGLIRWHGHAAQLTDDFLKSFLETDQVPDSLLPTENSSSKENRSANKGKFYELIITETVSTKGSSFNMNDNNGLSLSFVNYNLVQIISTLKDISTSRIEVKGKNSLPPALDISFNSKVISETDYGISSLLNILETTFKYKVYSEIKMQEIWSIRCANPEKLKKYDQNEKGGNHSSWSGQEWIGTRVSPADLRSNLERHFNIIAVDHSNLIGKFDFSFPTTDIKTAKEFLEQEYGIIINIESEEIEKIILDFTNGENS